MGQAVWAAAPQGFDEVFDRDGRPKPHYAPIVDLLGGLSAEERRRREELQTLALRTQGITFNVYGSDDGEERIFPFDFVPRIIPASEWRVLEKGLIQRVEALNVFLNDLYSEQRILKDGVIPWDLILGRDEYRRELMGVTPPHGIFTH
ncbi:MAG: circularly permuted type 2 ATP-grasp protein, partial [Fimbriimonadaceae bacterium]|nr:circularly permuted type 2 ATP-grasp protein [Fimbriimonadaceae bacterium]